MGLSISSISYGDAPLIPSDPITQEFFISQQAKHPIPRNQIGIETTRSFPARNTSEHFGPSSQFDLNLSYRNRLSDDWLAVLSIGHKSLTFKKSAEELIFFALTHEIYKIFLVQYPVYIGVGGKIVFLTPNTDRSLPGERRGDVGNEVGAALSLLAIYPINSEWIIHSRIDRWRGTGTSRFHSLEFALGVSYSFESYFGNSVRRPKMPSS